jgi:hypothetical protein
MISWIIALMNMIVHSWFFQWYILFLIFGFNSSLGVFGSSLCMFFSSSSWVFVSSYASVWCIWVLLGVLSIPFCANSGFYYVFSIPSMWVLGFSFASIWVPLGVFMAPLYVHLGSLSVPLIPYVWDLNFSIASIWVPPSVFLALLCSHLGSLMCSQFLLCGFWFFAFECSLACCQLLFVCICIPLVCVHFFVCGFWVSPLWAYGSPLFFS